MIKKTQLEEMIKSFPEEFTLEGLVDTLILPDNIEKGNRDAWRKRAKRSWAWRRNEEMVQIKWTEQVRKDLFDIFEYISIDSGK